MPRDTETKAYITATVNKDSELMRQLVEDYKRKNIPISHLLVQYADEYVRLVINGEIWKHISPTVSMQNTPTASYQEKEESLFTLDINDDELNAYGD